MTTTRVASFRNVSRLLDNRFAFLIMCEFELRGHLNRVLRAGFRALRAKRAKVKVEDRSLLPVDLLHPAGGGRAITGTEPAADATVEVKLHLPSEMLRRCEFLFRVKDRHWFLEHVYPDLRQHLPRGLHGIHPAYRTMMIMKI